jgi:hypothetical protein
VDKLLEDSIKKYLIEPVASGSLDKLPRLSKLIKRKAPRTERIKERRNQNLVKQKTNSTD